LKWFGLILLTLIVVVTALAAHAWYAKPLAISWFYNRVLMQFAIDNPELLTQLRILEQIGIHSHNAKFGDSSLVHEYKVFAKLVSDEAMLRSYDTSNFKGQDKLSYDILAYFLGNQVRGAEQFAKFDDAIATGQ